MRAMWKGAIAFGLVNVPIKLYSATEDHDVRFHQVHAADGGRIKMQRTCSVDGEKVEFKDLAKAFEAPDGRVVMMDESDFSDLPVPGVREIEVLEFVPSDQVDPVLFDRSYYLEPESTAVKPYVLLREALEQTDRTAITRVVLRSKTQLAALRVRGDVIVLQTMLWPDEVRAAEFDVLDDAAEPRAQEMQMAASLIDSLSSDFDPDEYRDEYREALLAVIDAKLGNGEGVMAPAAAASAEDGDGLVLDLMAALRASVERSKGDAGSDSGAEPAAEAPAKPAARTRRTTKSDDDAKPAAGRTAARKSTAKKAEPAAKAKRATA